MSKIKRAGTAPVVPIADIAVETEVMMHEMLNERLSEIVNTPEYKERVEAARLASEKRVAEGQRQAEIYRKAIKKFTDFLLDVVKNTDCHATSIQETIDDLDGIMAQWMIDNNYCFDHIDLTHPASSYLKCQIYHDLNQSVGFWGESTGFDAPQELIEDNWVSTTEAYNVVQYMQQSSKHMAWCGWADCRICREHLGSHDMLTPDGKWLFPELWEHYIIEHSVKINNSDFIRDAVEWNKGNQYDGK